MLQKKINYLHFMITISWVSDGTRREKSEGPPK